MLKVSLNCDMGEGFGLYKLGDDEKLLEIIDVANVACGFHAGDPCIMDSTIKCAKLNRVSVGAHPSFPDLQGFGRRAMALTPNEVKQFVTYQIGALKGFLEANQMKLNHVKPHGSLYGVGCRNEETCRAIVEAVSVFGVPLIAPANTKFEEMAKEYNVPFWPEFFADLDYDDNGNLIITREHQAVDPLDAASRTKLALENGIIRSINGKDIPIKPVTICIHSDTPGALEISRAVRNVIDIYNMQDLSPGMQTNLSIKSVLIANRGEIACRIIKTCKKMGIRTVSIAEVDDSNMMHTVLSDENVDLSPGIKYTDIKAIIDISKKKNVDAVHPGYGFLSENPNFCAAVEDSGMKFLGPTSDIIKTFGQKHAARELAVKVGVPIVPGSKLLREIEHAIDEAKIIKFPVILKATGGGGGIGMSVCENEESLMKHFKPCIGAAERYFGNSGVYLEKYYPKSRHIEVQIFGDGYGNVIDLGERECSVQRRNQKVIEETPSPFLINRTILRQQLSEAAINLAKAVQYRSVGTVEFLVVDEGDGSPETGKFFFLEMNTRLQVEHAITEAVTGIDLVEWMILQANTEKIHQKGLDISSYYVRPQGHSIEVRIYAENPVRNFNPCPGLLTEVAWPEIESLRIDTWIQTGTQVSPHYDPMLAKVIVHDDNRNRAIDKIVSALSSTTIEGPCTNKEYLVAVLECEDFRAGHTRTNILKDVHFVPQAIEVLQGGMETSVQDWPGRIGLRVYGIQPNGPMDDLAFRIANIMVGNSEGTCGLEVTLRGPQILFHVSTVIAVTGAPFDVSIVDKSGKTEVKQMWSRFLINAGSTLKIGKPPKGLSGCRCYLAFSGGLKIPDYLGSKSTFPAFGYGGYQGRKLNAGDILPLAKSSNNTETNDLVLPSYITPKYQSKWEIKVLPGPQSDPDYVTPEGMDVFFSADWKVHYNSNRMGIRIAGPTPKWARPDGGEGGSHPSNVNDNAYPLGGINCTGDSPVVLTIEGPSQGGFVCPFTILSSEMWKTGQVSPGDIINFTPVTLNGALKIRKKYTKYIEYVREIVRHHPRFIPLREFPEVTKTDRIKTDIDPTIYQGVAVLSYEPGNQGRPAVQYRQAGDTYVLVEYGDPKASVDLNYRARVKVLQDYLQLNTDTKTSKVSSPRIAGTIDAAPCLRTLLIRYDPNIIAQSTLVEYLSEIEKDLPDSSKMVFKTREVHLPFAFDDQWSKGATEVYMQNIRKEASYLPSNVDFIVKNNNLKDKEELKEYVSGTPMLVAGVGFFVGCPFLVPVNPLKILNVPKYNPARNYTASGTVGMGGPYSAIYPMESPGGYQMYGRTIQTWNSFGSFEPFSPDQPWLLNLLDQVIFDLVSEEELLEYRRLAAIGKYKYRIKDSVLDMEKHNKFVKEIKNKLSDEMKARRGANKAMLKIEEEILKKQSGTGTGSLPLSDVVAYHQDNVDLPLGMKAIETLIVGCVKSVNLKVGDTVTKDLTVICVLEAMKTEIEIISDYSGTVTEVLVTSGQQLASGDVVCIIKES